MIKLESLAPGEYVVVARIDYSEHQDFSSRLDTSAFQIGIRNLRRGGLDIGKGNAEYGYRMPIPKKDTNQRQLIIFRRR